MDDGSASGLEKRFVSARIEADVRSSTDIAFAIAVADHHQRALERMIITIDGEDLAVTEVAGPHHGRFHVVKNVPRGRLVVDYEATVVGAAPPLFVTDLEMVQYLRPSRYCESDRLGELARAEFAGLRGQELLESVASWVGTKIAYRPGTSRPIDGAVETLLAREGVCRDFAHLSAALLRANGVAARVVSVYAPGLKPMDFHAVTEAVIDGAWYVIDPTCLAPRSCLTRIATGADASDTAFATTLRGELDFVGLSVSATIDAALPADDLSQLTTLG